jgi:head-tail adaptor
VSALTGPQPAAQIATLQAPGETETPYGGRARVWSDVATLWVRLKPGGATLEQLQDQRPVRIETASAAARDHPDAAAGQRLVADGPPWRVLAVQRPGGGRMTLLLDRTP